MISAIKHSSLSLYNHQGVALKAHASECTGQQKTEHSLGECVSEHGLRQHTQATTSLTSLHNSSLAIKAATIICLDMIKATHHPLIPILLFN